MAATGAASFEVSAPYDGLNWNTYCVVTSNDQRPVEYRLSRAAARMSGLLKDILEDQNDGDHTFIPVPGVNGRTLKYVIEYLEYHKDAPAEPIEKPLKGKIDDVVCEWDKTFLFRDLVRDHDERQHDLLIDVVMAANFLNIKDLLDLTCACIASMIKGKTPEQIRSLFNIENDFTAEEEAKIREENRWCEES